MGKGDTAGSRIRK